MGHGTMMLKLRCTNFPLTSDFDELVE